jgi:HEAT repeat protein
VSDRSALRRALSDLFEAERTRQALADQIASGSLEDVLEVLRGGIAAARTRDEEEERVLELEAIAQILGQLPGSGAVDALIEVLGSEEPEARHAAGVALEEISYERFKEVALGVERALASLPPDHLALTELPYLLIGIPEPGIPRLIHRFLEHANEEVVSAAIEACVELGDPSSVSRLEKLENDARLIRLEDDRLDDGDEAAGDGGGTITVGELAQEARRTIEGMSSEEPD